MGDIVGIDNEKSAFVKDLGFADLLCVYGQLLTEKQRDVLDLYYNEDLSLSEIAENTGISRQGVRDSIKRGEEALTYFEQTLKLYARQKAFDEIMGAILEQAKSIRKDLSPITYSWIIQQKADTLINDIEDGMKIFD